MLPPLRMCLSLIQPTVHQSRTEGAGVLAPTRLPACHARVDSTTYRRTAAAEIEGHSPSMLPGGGSRSRTKALSFKSPKSFDFLWWAALVYVDSKFAYST